MLSIQVVKKTKLPSVCAETFDNLAKRGCKPGRPYGVKYVSLSLSWGTPSPGGVPAWREGSASLEGLISQEEKGQPGGGG